MSNERLKDLTCHRMEVYDEANEQESLGGDESGDEEEAEPEGVVHKDSPATAKASKSHPQQVNKVPPDIDGAGTFDDDKVHFGWK